MTSRTHKAVAKAKLAHLERTARPAPQELLAQQWERQAAELLRLPEPPRLGIGGEAVGTGGFRETLDQDATATAVDASFRRVELTQLGNLDVLPEALDTAESIGATNAVEKMLAHQMAAAHATAMRMLDRGLSYMHKSAQENVEAARCVNAAARLMSAFGDAAVTLQRLRTGGEQRVHVEHVHVAPGGRAIVGAVTAGASTRRGRAPRNG